MSSLLPPDVVGLTEFATMAGVDRTTVAKWITRGRDLPPFTRLACGPVWKRAHVERWVAVNRVDAAPSTN